MWIHPGLKERLGSELDIAAHECFPPRDRVLSRENDLVGNYPCRESGKGLMEKSPAPFNLRSFRTTYEYDQRAKGAGYGIFEHG
jgi:hypothetical protein